MDAHEQAGLQADPKLLFRLPASRQGGEQLARRLNTMHNPPSAIFVADQVTHCPIFFTKVQCGGGLAAPSHLVE